MPRTRMFRVGTSPSQSRRFRLPEGQKMAAPYAELEPEPKPVKSTLRTTPSTAKYEYPQREPARTRTPRRDRAQTGSTATVTSPVPARKGRDTISFVCATEEWVSGFLGPIRLRCGPENVDLRRLELGNLSLITDHDSTKPIGRVVQAHVGGGQVHMVAEIGRSPRALAAHEDIVDGVRGGFSPAFLVSSYKVLTRDDDDYDEDKLMQVDVRRWEIFEASSTVQPKNPYARLKGAAAMTTPTKIESIHDHDMMALSLAAGRQVLASDTGSKRQRVVLANFFRTFDDERAAGRSQDEAAQTARQAAGLA